MLAHVQDWSASTISIFFAVLCFTVVRVSPVACFDVRSSLIAKYFDAVDPVYPMIHRHSFQKDYDNFWSLSPPKRNEVKGDLVALIFVMLAMGTQFVSLPSLDGKEQTAEFYGKNAAALHAPRAYDTCQYPRHTKLYACRPT